MLRDKKQKMSVTPRLQANSERRQHFLPRVGLFANDGELTRRRAFIFYLLNSVKKPMVWRHTAQAHQEPSN